MDTKPVSHCHGRSLRFLTMCHEIATHARVILTAMQLSLEEPILKGMCFVLAMIISI